MQPSGTTPAGDVGNAALKAENKIYIGLRRHCTLVSLYVVSEAVVYQLVRRENTVDILGVDDERFWAQRGFLWHATTETARDGVVYSLKKLITSACYDKQHVCVYLQPFSC